MKNVTKIVLAVVCLGAIAAAILAYLKKEQVKELTDRVSEKIKNSKLASMCSKKKEPEEILEDVSFEDVTLDEVEE